MRFIISLVIVGLFFSCNNQDNTPDVSNIKINIITERYEKDLFSADTNDLNRELNLLLQKYPDFGVAFNSTILNADPTWSKDTLAMYLQEFIRSYRTVYDTAEKIYADFSPYEKEISKAVQLLKYYFPAYKAPNKIITYIGPIDGYGDILTEDAFIIGLHHHLGGEASFYKSMWLHETYPAYIIRRFDPAFININCMRNIVNDLIPSSIGDASLITQIIEEGKRLYILEKLLPDVEKNNLIAYSAKQLSDCYSHEAQIWDLFIQNNLLQTIDKNVIKNYIGEGPKTQELGDESPGNIGAFVGWQIVKKFMKNSNKLSLNELIQIDAEAIMQTAKYKP